MSKATYKLEPYKPTKTEWKSHEEMMKDIIELWDIMANGPTQPEQHFMSQEMLDQYALLCEADNE